MELTEQKELQTQRERADLAEARAIELESDLEHARWENIELEQLLSEYQDAKRCERASADALPA